jgi:hypothetical protein
MIPHILLCLLDGYGAPCWMEVPRFQMKNVSACGEEKPGNVNVNTW